MKLSFTIYVAAIIAFFATGCSREHEEYIDGQGEAERDLAKGEFKVAIVDGANLPAFWEYTDLLLQRYNIKWCVYSLPANPPAAEAWVRGYNEVVAPKIELKFGTNILKQTMEDAKKLYDAKSTKP